MSSYQDTDNTRELQVVEVDRARENLRVMERLQQALRLCLDDVDAVEWPVVK